MSDWTRLEKVVGAVLLICFLGGLWASISGNVPRWNRRIYEGFNSVPEGVTTISSVLLVLYGIYMFNKYSQSDGI